MKNKMSEQTTLFPDRKAIKSDPIMAGYTVRHKKRLVIKALTLMTHFRYDFYWCVQINGVTHFLQCNNTLNTTLFRKLFQTVETLSLQ